MALTILSEEFNAIPVIVSFDCKGQIKPLYIRIGDESLKVHHVFLMSHNFSGSTFRCEVMDGDKCKEVKIFYHADKLIWTLLK